jgi:hypothetical protein
MVLVVSVSQNLQGRSAQRSPRSHRLSRASCRRNETKHLCDGLRTFVPCARIACDSVTELAIRRFGAVVVGGRFVQGEVARIDSHSTDSGGNLRHNSALAERSASGFFYAQLHFGTSLPALACWPSPHRSSTRLKMSQLVPPASALSSAYLL